MSKYVGDIIAMALATFMAGGVSIFQFTHKSFQWWDWCFFVAICFCWTMVCIEAISDIYRTKKGQKE